MSRPQKGEHLTPARTDAGGYQQQYYQQQQGEEASYVCGECERHQEDIPPSHYAAAVGHLACLQVRKVGEHADKDGR